MGRKLTLTGAVLLIPESAEQAHILGWVGGGYASGTYSPVS